MTRHRKIEQKQTMLVTVEGPTDEIFFRQIRSEVKEHNNLKIKIVCAKSISRVIQKATARQYSGFDCKIGIVDNKDMSEQAKTELLQEAKENKITIIEHTICLEATLLQLFPIEEKVSGGACEGYKKGFQKNYLKNSKKVKDYREFFKRKINKTFLQKHRKKIDILDKIMLYIEKGCNP